MSSLLGGLDNFNEDLSGWDTGGVTDMYHMFDQATTFDNGGETLSFDTANVEDMGNMFEDCEARHVTRTSLSPPPTCPLLHLSSHLSTPPSTGLPQLASTFSTTNRLLSALRQTMCVAAFVLPVAPAFVNV